MAFEALNFCKVVLVEPSHPGNIGSAARAMKTMGLSQLVLVKPLKFPDKEATTLASNATDILATAQVVDTLDEALSGVNLVMGSSARTRRLDWPLITPHKAAQKAVTVLKQKATSAILFGRERTGLKNDELAKCHYHIHIPTDPDYSSLNLAQAVQVLCYELRMAMIDADDIKQRILAPHEELEKFYVHWEKMLTDVGYLNPKNPRKLMERMRRLFQRAELDANEVSLLRGVCQKAMSSTSK